MKGGEEVFDDLLQFLKPSSVGDIIFYIVIVIGVVILIKSLINSKGEFKLLGIFDYKPSLDNEIRKELTAHIISNDAFNKNISNIVESAAEDRKELYKKIERMIEMQVKQGDDITRLRTESVKTQILLTNTSYERKLYLFDIYKQLGGNGWLEDWMADYIKKHKKTETCDG